MLRSSALLSLLVLAACSSTVGPATDAGTDAGRIDAGQNDSGEIDSGTLDAGRDAGPVTVDAGCCDFWDGGSCAVKTDCPCFSSDDCPPTHWCHSEDDTGANVFCIPGARGTGLVGDGCTGETDCRSALCISSSTAGMRCSALCVEDAGTCHPSLPRCLYVGFGVDRFLCSP